MVLYPNNFKTWFWIARKPPTPPIEFPSATPPYKHYVAGAGIIEAASEDINIGTPFNEIVTDIYVKVGDFAAEGMPLFALDTRTLVAEYEDREECFGMRHRRG
jgi:multidrug efflux pump subunit AcrA (membrane-fusion protein)